VLKFQEQNFLFRKSFQHRGAIDWNDLGSTVRGLTVQTGFPQEAKSRVNCFTTTTLDLFV